MMSMYQNMLEDVFIMQGKNGEMPTFTPEDLVKEIEATRQFILDLAIEVPDTAGISARMVAEAIRPLEYLSQRVEYRTLNQKGGQQ